MIGLRGFVIELAHFALDPIGQQLRALRRSQARFLPRKAAVDKWQHTAAVRKNPPDVRVARSRAGKKQAGDSASRVGRVLDRRTRYPLRDRIAATRERMRIDDCL